MASESEVIKLLRLNAIQGAAYKAREKSRAEINYGNAMEDSAKALIELTHTASFNQLLTIEKSYQTNDLLIYAKKPLTIQSVQAGMRDLDAGESVYEQLLSEPDAYRRHTYRDSEMAKPDKLVPLDAMRKALRGQVSRVQNYGKLFCAIMKVIIITKRVNFTS